MSCCRIAAVAALTLACGLAGAARAQAISPGLAVYDADGRYVGNILDQDNIWMKLSDSEAVVKTDPAGAFQAERVNLYFTTANCSGVAYMDASAIPVAAGFLPAAEASSRVSRGTLFYPARPYRMIAAYSCRPAGSADCSRFPARTEIIGGKAAFLRLDGYNPPFSIR